MEAEEEEEEEEVLFDDFLLLLPLLLLFVPRSTAAAHEFLDGGFTCFFDLSPLLVFFLLKGGSLSKLISLSFVFVVDPLSLLLVVVFAALFFLFCFALSGFWVFVRGPGPRKKLEKKH